MTDASTSSNQCAHIPLFAAGAGQIAREVTPCPRCEIERLQGELDAANQHVKILSEARDRIAVETTAPRETGWLIENGRPAPKTEYRGMDEMGIHWTADINKALRFARRADAEAFASEDVNAWSVVQHEWVIVDGDSIHAVEPSGLTDERRLRRMLAFAYSGPGELYGDDGELQNGAELPIIDFNRDSVSEIERKITERGKRRLAKAQQEKASGERCALREMHGDRCILGPGHDGKCRFA